MNKPISVRFGEIKCSTVEGKPGWRRLTEDFLVIVSMSDGSTNLEYMNKGFEWDGSSTPWIFRLLVPKFESTLEGSCLHDKICIKALKMRSKKIRKYGDICYKLCLEHKKGLNWFQTFSGYTGVRLGALWNIAKGDLKV